MYVVTEKVPAFGEEERLADEQLVARIVLDGDTTLFGCLYRRYHARIFTLAYGMSGEKGRAEDLSQEIFLRAYQSLPGFRGEATFSTWLYRLATNHCLNSCRRERWRRGHVVGLAAADVLPSRGTEARPDENVRREELQAELRRALMSLKPQMRLLVVLRELEGLSYAEIAERLDSSEGSVASGLSRARALLARKLERLKGKI